jgi:hypothetical protein
MRLTVATHVASAVRIAAISPTQSLNKDRCRLVFKNRNVAQTVLVYLLLLACVPPVAAAKYIARGVRHDASLTLSVIPTPDRVFGGTEVSRSGIVVAVAFSEVERMDAD